MDSLSNAELRTFLVAYHSLDCYDHFAGKEGVKKTLRRLGSVQYDPLNVVGRNPDLVFQSRVRGYTPELLYELLYKDRSLVDGWDKEMSIYLTSDRPFFARVQRSREESGRRTLEHRNQIETLSYIPDIMEEIKTRGPLAARNIKLGACADGGWGHRRISGVVLDYLYTAGKLGIHGKKNAQKTYGLIGDLLPKKILDAKDPFTNDSDFFEWYVLRRIGSMGVHWQRSGGGWLGHFLGDPALRKKAFAFLEEKNLIVPVKVFGMDETVYIRKKDLLLLNKKPEFDGIARILAPLDNMLWDRLLVKKVFGFEYTWEVYVPEAKRKYGYYVLPVLYQNNLIARFEPVKHEKGKALEIKNWWWEDAGPDREKNALQKNPEVREAVIRGLENFAAYLNAAGVEKTAVKKLFGGK